MRPDSFPERPPQRRRLAKRPPDVQQDGGDIGRLKQARGKRKAAESGGFLLFLLKASDVAIKAAQVRRAHRRAPIRGLCRNHGLYPRPAHDRRA